MAAAGGEAREEGAPRQATAGGRRKSTQLHRLARLPWWRRPFSRQPVLIEPADGGLEPSVPHRSVVMIVPRRRREWEPGAIYALRIGKRTIVRRAALDERGGRLMACDNPDWPDLPLPEGARIIGRACCFVRPLE